MVAAAVAVRLWLEERCLVVACQLVKTAVVCRSVGSSPLNVDSERILRVLTCCIDFLSL